MKYILALTLVLTCQFSYAAQKVVVILDNSSSMNEIIEKNQKSRMRVAQDSLATVLHSVNDETLVGVLLLNGTKEFPTGWVMDVSKVQKQELIDRIYRVRPNGGTPLGAAIKKASDRLLRLKKDEKYGEYKLLILTDGESTDSIEQNLFESMERGIGVDAIGLDMSKEHVLATKIDNYQSASEEKQLSLALESSFAEVKSSDNLQDFELLASIPDEMIPHMITALNDSGNQPIGEEFVESNPNRINQNYSSSNQVVSSDTGNLIFRNFLFGLMIGVIVVVAGAILSKLASS